MSDATRDAVPTCKGMEALVRAHEIECDKYGRGDPDTHLLRTGAALRDAHEHLLATIEQQRAAMARLRVALEWLVNVGHGVGKAGGPPESHEIEDALTAGRTALSALVAPDETTTTDHDSHASKGER